MFRDDGVINSILLALGIKNPPQWFVSLQLNKIPIIVMVVWTAVGYELVIYMSALQSVPTSLYEAADIDRATGMQKFFYITLPMVSPTTFYLVIVRMIAVFKIFSSVNIMTMAPPPTPTPPWWWKSTATPLAATSLAMPQRSPWCCSCSFSSLPCSTSGDRRSGFIIKERRTPHEKE